jgi:tetratricopeptide (TPR) repeat protein
MTLPAFKGDAFIAELIAQPGEFRVRQLLREMKAALPNAPTLRARAVLHTGLGMACHQLGKHDDAIAQHETACKLDSSTFTIPNNYGVTLERMGRIEDALHWYGVAIRAADGYNPTTLGNFATTLARLGESEEAHKVLAEAIRILEDPDDLPAMAARAAEIGLPDVALQLVARHAAATHGVEFDASSPLSAIAAAPNEWRERHLTGYDLACAVLRAYSLADKLPKVDTAHAPMKSGGSTADALDRQVFELSRRTRDRATDAGFAEYHGE